MSSSSSSSSSISLSSSLSSSLETSGSPTTDYVFIDYCGQMGSSIFVHYTKIRSVLSTSIPKTTQDNFFYSYEREERERRRRREEKRREEGEGEGEEKNK